MFAEDLKKLNFIGISSFGVDGNQKAIDKQLFIKEIFE